MAPGVTRRRRNRYDMIDERDLRDALTKTTRTSKICQKLASWSHSTKGKTRETKPYRTEAP